MVYLGLDPADCLMIGNDPLCDVAGAAAVNMNAVYIRSALSPRTVPTLRSCHPERSEAESKDPHPPVLSLPRMDLRRLRRLLLRDGPD